jgi:predicted RNA methylase
MKKVVGIELVPELAEIAQANISRIPLKSPAEIRCHDVACTSLDDGTVYFNYQSFGSRTTRQVLESIRVSLDTAPRPVFVVCVNDVDQDLYRACGWLTLRQAIDNRIFLWTNTPGDPAWN